MPGVKTLLPMSACALAVAGCAWLAPSQTTTLVVHPVQSVRHAIDPQALYLSGRYFQGQLRYEQALEAYAQALAADPGHVDAHNASGVVHSLQGRPDEAGREFRAALALAPGDAGVRNNLGYHLLRQGRAQEALITLEQARTLDPGDALIASNLVAARRQLGISDLPFPTRSQPAAQAAVRPTAGAAAMELVSVSAGVWQLRPASTLTPPTEVVAKAGPPDPGSAAQKQTRTELTSGEGEAAAPVARPGAVPANAGLQVEISNGKGANGLAQRVADALRGAGALDKARVTNNKPWGTVLSRVEFVDGSESTAQLINASLSAPLPLTRVPALGRSIKVRVLIGRDFVLPARAA